VPQGWCNRFIRAGKDGFKVDGWVRSCKHGSSMLGMLVGAIYDDEGRFKESIDGRQDGADVWQWASRNGFKGAAAGAGNEDGVDELAGWLGQTIKVGAGGMQCFRLVLLVVDAYY
jgi:hypothetical protein